MPRSYVLLVLENVKMCYASVFKLSLRGVLIDVHWFYEALYVHLDIFVETIISICSAVVSSFHKCTSLLFCVCFVTFVIVKLGCWIYILI